MTRITRAKIHSPNPNVDVKSVYFRDILFTNHDFPAPFTISNPHFAPMWNMMQYDFEFATDFTNQFVHDLFTKDSDYNFYVVFKIFISWAYVELPMDESVNPHVPVFPTTDGTAAGTYCPEKYLGIVFITPDSRPFFDVDVTYNDTGVKVHKTYPFEQRLELSLRLRGWDQTKTRAWFTQRPPLPQPLDPLTGLPQAVDQLIDLNSLIISISDTDAQKNRIQFKLNLPWPIDSPWRIIPQQFQCETFNIIQDSIIWWKLDPPSYYGVEFCSADNRYTTYDSAVVAQMAAFDQEVIEHNRGGRMTAREQERRAGFFRRSEVSPFLMAEYEETRNYQRIQSRIRTPPITRVIYVSSSDEEDWPPLDDDDTNDN